MHKLELIIPGLPPTDNNIYATGQRGRFKSKAAKGWESTVMAAILQQSRRPQRSVFADQHLAITLRFFFRLYSEKGAMQRWDVSSHQKLTVDIVCTMLERDDRHVITLDLAKYDIPPDDEACTHVTVVTAHPAQLTKPPG